MNGNANITPNDAPVSSIEKIQMRILPKRRDSGIHIGTENVDGIMYARMIAGARPRLPTTYCATYSVSAPIAAEPTLSMNVTMISSRACGLRQTSANALYGRPIGRFWNSARSRSFQTANSTIPNIRIDASQEIPSAAARVASGPLASALMKICMLASARIEPSVNAAWRRPNRRLRS